jgi:N-acetylglucosamine repressor
MDTNFTVAALKAKNKKNILDYIYKKKEVTPQMISEDMNLSRPTIAQVLKEYLQEDVIYQKGNAESTGGRKAKKYVFKNLGRIAIGVEILSDRYEIVAVDLYVDMLKFEKIILPYSNTEDYYIHLCESVNRFIEGLQTTQEKILGVGIALQGLISYDGKKVIYGKILDCTGLGIDEFNSKIPFPCTFNHDGESVANEELWLEPKIENAVFFNIRDNLSGAVIINGKFFRGGDLKSGIFEHMTLVPNGEPCYCGKKGCVNAYCSINALLRPEENIENFFYKLRNNTPQIKKRWNSYLEYLSIIIDNLHMFINSDVILGGTLSKYLIKEDVLKLQKMTQKRTAFPSSEYRIKISQCKNLPLCIGAAIPFVKKYLEELE